jgi:peroxiredoxin
MIDTFYTLLGVSTKATPEEITTAYTQQRERYNPERVADMGEDMRRIAAQRTAELDHAYEILSDPQQRQAYDARIGISNGASQSSPLSSVPTPVDTTHKTRERWFAIGGVVVGLLLVAAVWVWAGNQETNSAAAPSVNRPAPDFTLLTPDGEEITLADYRGQVVLVNFWGSWCGPCVNEIPELQTAYEELNNDGLMVIGVNLFDNEQAQDQTEEDIQAFVEANGITYPVVLDAAGEVTKAYRVFPIPTSFFVDPNGYIRYVLPRELTAKEIRQWFVELQQESTALHTTKK